MVALEHYFQFICQDFFSYN